METRLSGGFPWAPFRGTTPSESLKDDFQTTRSAGQILTAESASTDSSPALEHAAASASLLMQNPADALVRFEQLIQRAPYDATVWNDLGAARYELAVERSDPAGLPAALAAVDRALALKRRFPEAAFNRALILAQLGLTTEAKRAWRDAAAVESTIGWRREANARLRALNNEDAPEFSPQLQRALASAKAGDGKPMSELAHDRTQELRMAGEALALNSWPEAVMRGDAPSSRQILERARLIATAVGNANGDWLLSDVVRSIERGQSDRTYRRLTIDAHKAYRAARMTLFQQLPDSDLQLQRAAVLFDHIGSPMAPVARYYSANAMFDRNRVENCRRILIEIVRTVDAQRYPSLVAGAERQLGFYYAFQGMWAASLLHLERALQIYTRLGEAMNAAFAESIVAEVYERIGQFGEGWRHRRAALLVLGRTSSSERLASAMAGAVHGEMLRGELESALSLLRITIELAQKTGNPVLIAETRIREARVLLAIRSRTAAVSALRDAENAVDKIRDPLTRSRIQADVWVMESEILRRREPQVAREIVTRAIAFYEAKHFHMLLPTAFLERGRASLAANDETLALDDFLKGLADVENQRRNVVQENRMTVFDTVPDLLAEALSLLLKRDRKAEAFALVESARARTLTEALGLFPANGLQPVAAASIAGALPPRTILIEYALLPDAVAVFCIRARGTSVFRLPIHPNHLRDEVSRLTDAMESRQPADLINQISGEIYRQIIAPIRSQFDGADALIIVPDRFLNALSFPALFDARRRRYLIEDYRIVISPSSAFMLRRKRRHRIEPLLIINDPSLHNGDPSLPGSRKEAAGIAALYANAIVLSGPDATVERVLTVMPRSAVIHYAGHARSSESGGVLSLAASPRHDGRIDAASICRIRLPRTSLVVLAACATLRGSARRVEGMPSIARAFLAAGVPTVVGTLWEVDDRGTASLFLRFHESLYEGHSPAEALQAAQCALLHGESERLRHPAVWAAAEILGTDDLRRENTNPRPTQSGESEIFAGGGTLWKSSSQEFVAGSTLRRRGAEKP